MEVIFLGQSASLLLAMHLIKRENYFESLVEFQHPRWGESGGSHSVTDDVTAMEHVRICVHLRIDSLEVLLFLFGLLYVKRRVELLTEQQKNYNKYTATIFIWSVHSEHLSPAEFYSVFVVLFMP